MDPAIQTTLSECWNSRISICCSSQIAAPRSSLSQLLLAPQYVNKYPNPQWERQSSSNCFFEAEPFALNLDPRSLFLALSSVILNFLCPFLLATASG